MAFIFFHLLFIKLINNVPQNSDYHRTHFQINACTCKHPKFPISFFLGRCLLEYLNVQVCKFNKVQIEIHQLFRFFNRVMRVGFVMMKRCNKFYIDCYITNLNIEKENKHRYNDRCLFLVFGLCVSPNIRFFLSLLTLSERKILWAGYFGMH